MSGAKKSAKTKKAATPKQATQPAAVEFSGSRLFAPWLAEQNASIVFTTYQAGKVFFIGLNEQNGFSVFERTFDRCMGLATRGRDLWMSSRYQLWRFRNILEAGHNYNGYDASFVPMVGHTTGDIDVHDMAIGADGKPMFITTLFNSLATLDDNNSFAPMWQPPFISGMQAEDRCHLNGLAVDEDGVPRYATAVSTSNVAEGWRESRRDGGVVIDIQANEIIATGFSMPHSPRLYQGRLWVLNAGTGEFGYVDPDNGRFEPLAFCPGFLRGMAFIGDYAIVGLSRPRNNRTFEGLVVNDRLEKEGVPPVCGLRVINLNTGAVTHSLMIEGIVQELYDVAVIPDVTRPMALGFSTDEIAFHVSVGEDAILPSV